MEPKYDIDPSELNQVFKQVQKFIHPDKFELATEQMKDSAHELSAYVNNAYFTLGHDLERAEYLLKLMGLETEESMEKNIISSKNAMDNVELLQRVFEMRMEIDSCDSYQELRTLKQEVKKQMQDEIERIRELFKDGKYTEVKKEVDGAKYLEKMLEEIGLKETQLKTSEWVSFEVPFGIYYLMFLWFLKRRSDVFYY